MNYWLGVVQRSHVLRGVALGIAQVNHGAASVRRLQPGDGLVYYSPKTDYPDGDPLREFTAIGRIAAGDAWQADDGDRHPWRRRVEFDESAHPTPIAPLLEQLELTRGNRNWGYVMRRGQLPLTRGDFATIAHAMGADSLLG
jgi:hypothetical protein